jgi:molybdopterin/thiamine biosynthesis adenylyltransferase
MERVSDRHEDDLGGRLLPFEDSKIANVTVVVEDGAAHLASTQHTAWMLLNLLARSDGIVGRIGLVCPAGVALSGPVVPLAPRDTDLRSALLRGVRQIGAVPAELGEELDGVLVVGPGEALQECYRVYWEGWWGGISVGPIRGSGTSSLPFGPYIAACFAAAEVFKAARMKPEAYERPEAVFYSAWSHESSAEPPLGGPDAVDNLVMDAAIAGVGAVGSAWVHAIWACQGVTGAVVLADNDRKGVERTNLNRYPLFGRSSLGQPKASEAARLAPNASIHWIAHDKAFEELGIKAARLICAVDINRARAALQNLYPPRILGASTFDLRAEILRCGPPGEGACLRCFNPPEMLPPDETIRARLREASDEELATLAAEVDISTEEAKAWSWEGRCGQAGERLLNHIRQTDEGPRQFTVGFVSVMAGTLLAAETVKDICGADVPLSDKLSRAVVQFWHPTARTNKPGFFGRDPGCSACKPGEPSTKVWGRRFEQLQPLRAS